MGKLADVWQTELQQDSGRPVLAELLAACACIWALAAAEEALQGVRAGLKVHCEVQQGSPYGGTAQSHCSPTETIPSPQIAPPPQVAEQGELAVAAAQR